MYKQDINQVFVIEEDADGAGDWFWCGDATLVNIQLAYEASTNIAGAYTLQTSNSPIGTAQDDIEPQDTVPDSSFEITDDEGSRSWNVADVGWNWMRIVFTFDTASPEQQASARIVLKGPAPA